MKGASVYLKIAIEIGEADGRGVLDGPVGSSPRLQCSHTAAARATVSSFSAASSALRPFSLSTLLSTRKDELLCKSEKEVNCTKSHVGNFTS